MKKRSVYAPSDWFLFVLFYFIYNPCSVPVILFVFPPVLRQSHDKRIILTDTLQAGFILGSTLFHCKPSSFPNGVLFVRWVAFIFNVKW